MRRKVIRGNYIRGAIAATGLAAALSGMAAERGAVTVGFHAGTGGGGAEAAYDLNDRLAAYVSWSGFEYEADDAGEYSPGDAALNYARGGLHWFPRGGGWRLTGGVVLNRTQYEHVRGSDSGFREPIGNGLYFPEIDVIARFDDLAFYFGTGWTTGRGREGAGPAFTLDVGVVRQSAGDLGKV